MIFRVEKNKNYTVMSNVHLREKEMSLKAKGLLSWMLSNTDNWDYSIKGIVANCKESESAIKSTLKELQHFGYLKVTKCLPSKENSRIHYEYTVYECPYNKEAQGGDFQCLENQSVENPRQINTKTSNTKKRDNLSKDKLKKQESKQSSFTLENKKSSSKPNLYQQCVSLIDNYTEDEKLRKALLDYLQVRLQNKEKPLYSAKMFKALLNKLDREFKGSDKLFTVYQSTERGYASFFPVNDKKYTQANKTANMRELEGIPHDGRYDDEDHTPSGLFF